MSWEWVWIFICKKKYLTYLKQHSQVIDPIEGEGMSFYVNKSCQGGSGWGLSEVDNI